MSLRLDWFSTNSAWTLGWFFSTCTCTFLDSLLPLVPLGNLLCNTVIFKKYHVFTGHYGLFVDHVIQSVPLWRVVWAVFWLKSNKVSKLRNCKMGGWVNRSCQKRDWIALEGDALNNLILSQSHPELKEMNKTKHAQKSCIAVVVRRSRALIGARSISGTSLRWIPVLILRTVAGGP